ncbi:MAG: hypothetical protein DRI61_00435 [Chloroflexi bacterium]|nr:MAG: hypothetical protein DRI61_00435 [Chloroflexota bacterium]
MLWGDLLWIICSYLIGSVPFAFLIARMRGIDLREVGTRNIGGSNVWHSVGKLEGTIATILDIGKGALAVGVAQRLGLPLWAQAASAVAVVAGHNWPPMLRFQGGRGIGASLGAMLLLVPKAMGVALIFYALGFFSRALGLGVAVGLLILPLATWCLGYGTMATIVAAIMFIFMVIRRLTGIGVLEEIKASKEKGRLIAYRVLFDNNYGLGRLS